MSRIWIAAPLLAVVGIACIDTAAEARDARGRAGGFHASPVARLAPGFAGRPRYGVGRVIVAPVRGFAGDIRRRGFGGYGGFNGGRLSYGAASAARPVAARYGFERGVRAPHLGFRRPAGLYGAPAEGSGEFRPPAGPPTLYLIESAGSAPRMRADGGATIIGAGRPETIAPLEINGEEAGPRIIQLQVR